MTRPQRKASLLERLGRWNLRRLGARSETHSVGAPETPLHAFTFDRHPDAPADAPPLVLMHGVGSSATTFARLLRHLRPHVGPILLPEAPAHGDSATPSGPLTPDALFDLIGAWLDTVPPAPFVLYGNSLGGGAALRYAIERPERVKALVLLSPAGADSPPAELDALVSTFDFKHPRDARVFIRRLFHRPRWYHRVAATELAHRFAEPPLREFFARAGREDLLDPAAVSALPMPVLFMWGGAEKLLPEGHLAWFKRHLPRHARITEPPHFAHSSYIEHADEVARELLAFLRDQAVLP